MIWATLILGLVGGFLLAKAKTIKFNGGDIIASGYTKEQIENIEKVLEDSLKPAVPIISYTGPFPVVVPEVTIGEMSYLALGWHYNSELKTHEIVEIAYNPDTKQCKIFKMYNGGEYQAFVKNNFKIALSDKNLV